MCVRLLTSSSSFRNRPSVAPSAAVTPNASENFLDVSAADICSGSVEAVRVMSALPALVMMPRWSTLISISVDSGDGWIDAANNFASSVSFATILVTFASCLLA